LYSETLDEPQPAGESSPRQKLTDTAEQTAVARRLAFEQVAAHLQAQYERASEALAKLEQAVRRKREHERGMTAAEVVALVQELLVAARPTPNGKHH
jgi:hypothetical protein